MRGEGFGMTPETEAELKNKMLVLKESHFIQQYDLISGQLGNGNDEARESMKFFIQSFLSEFPNGSFEDFMGVFAKFLVSTGAASEEELGLK